MRAVVSVAAVALLVVDSVAVVILAGGVVLPVEAAADLEEAIGEAAEVAAALTLVRS
jgi:hypothetical protein